MYYTHEHGVSAMVRNRTNAKFSIGSERYNSHSLCAPVWDCDLQELWRAGGAIPMVCMYRVSRRKVECRGEGVRQRRREWPGAGSHCWPDQKGTVHVSNESSGWMPPQQDPTSWLWQQTTCQEARVDPGPGWAYEEGEECAMDKKDWRNQNHQKRINQNCLDNCHHQFLWNRTPVYVLHFYVCMLNCYESLCMTGLTTESHRLLS